MKKLVVLAVLLFATPVLAQPGGEGNNTNCNGVGNPNSPCVPSGGTGGTGGTGGGGGGAGGAGGSVTSTITNTNSPTNTNTQRQQQTQSVTNSGNNTGTSRSSSSATGGTTTTTVTTGMGSGQYPVNPATAASAYAPSIWGGNSCGLGASAGVQAPLFGVSGGAQWEGEGCEWRQRVALISQIDKAAGKEMACSRADVREAFARAGQPCQADLRTAAVAPAVVTPVIFDASPYRSASDCLNAAPPSARAACAGKP